MMAVYVTLFSTTNEWGNCDINGCHPRMRPLNFNLHGIFKRKMVLRVRSLVNRKYWELRNYWPVSGSVCLGAFSVNYHVEIM